MQTDTDTAREARARRRARAQGFLLRKGPNRYDRGLPTYWIIDPTTNGLVTSEYGMSLEEAEDWLNE
jgi:hypothetical protein